MNLHPFFNLDIQSSKDLQRFDGDPVINRILKTSNDKGYFLKEIQTHSMRAGMDEIYKNLSLKKPELSKYILPLQREDENQKFIFEKDDISFVLFEYVRFEAFSPQRISLTKFWNVLSEFHYLTARDSYPKHEFRNYRSWLEIGSRRLQKKFGEDLPFLKKFDDFIENQFPLIQFVSGPIHWDVHAENFGIDGDGRLLMFDFDLVQEGAYATDFLAAAALYIDWDNPFVKWDKDFLEMLFKKIEPMAAGISHRGLVHLLVRNILGDLALVESKDQVVEQLKKCELLLAAAKP